MKETRLRIRHSGPLGIPVLLLLCLGWTVQAQDIEPRRWSHLPIDMNFAGAGYSYTRADITFDPVLEAKDVTLDLHTLAAKYIRTMKFMGHSTRISLLVPLQDARWEGLVEGEPTTTRRTGFADPRIRLSMNLLGGPALQGAEFKEYRMAHPIETLAGAGLTVQLPLGLYERDKLLNLGENRFRIRPELGILHTHRKWSVELTGAMIIFTDNQDFWDGNHREQKPLYLVHGHYVYTFRPGLWVSAGTAYSYGGESEVNDVYKYDRKGDLAWVLSGGYPLGKTLTLKLTYLGSRTQKSTGLDSDTLATGLSAFW